MSDEGHNEMSRSEVIREIKKLLDECDDKAAALAATRKRIKSRIKTELGYKLGDWDAMVRLAELDEDRRTDLMIALREGFDALNVGEQHSFLEAIDPPATAAPAKTRAEEIAEIVAKQEAEDAERFAAQGATDDDAFDRELNHALELA